MSPTEARVAGICADLLGVERVDLDMNLYDLGSDSHQAILVALEIERAFEVSLPLEVMETTATVRALAAWVDGQRGHVGDAAAAGVDGGAQPR